MRDLMMRELNSVQGLAKTHQTKPFSKHWFDLSEKSCQMGTTWLDEKVAYGNDRAVEKSWKLLHDICVLRAVKDDMMLVLTG